MQRTGKTFSELSKSMDPKDFAVLTNQIAKADNSYIYFQTQRAEEIAKLKTTDPEVNNGTITSLA